MYRQENCHIKIKSQPGKQSEAVHCIAVKERTAFFHQGEIQSTVISFRRYSGGVDVGVFSD